MENHDASASGVGLQVASKETLYLHSRFLFSLSGNLAASGVP
jgi:hypothetical protein